MEALPRGGHSEGRGELRRRVGRRAGQRAGERQAAEGGFVHRFVRRSGTGCTREASKRRLRIQLEMGGKNPTIVLADADFNSAVENVVNAAFFSTGPEVHGDEPRDCRGRASTTSSSRRWWSGRRSLKVGDGMKPGIDIGPCVDKGQMETVLKYIEIGTQEGGRAVVRRQAADGRRLR